MLSRNKKSCCSGCHPIFQPNQMAHMDPGGCLYEDDIVADIVEKKEEYEVNIDFDEASKAWMDNKKSTGNGNYKYICEQITQMGEQCKREPKKSCCYCLIHLKINNKKLKNNTNI